MESICIVYLFSFSHIILCAICLMQTIYCVFKKKSSPKNFWFLMGRISLFTCNLIIFKDTLLLQIFCHSICCFLLIYSFLINPYYSILPFVNFLFKHFCNFFSSYLRDYKCFLDLLLLTFTTSWTRQKQQFNSIYTYWAFVALF